MCGLCWGPSSLHLEELLCVVTMVALVTHDRVWQYLFYSHFPLMFPLASHSPVILLLSPSFPSFLLSPSFLLRCSSMWSCLTCAGLLAEVLTRCSRGSVELNHLFIVAFRRMSYSIIFQDLLSLLFKMPVGMLVNIV